MEFSLQDQGECKYTKNNNGPSQICGGTGDISIVLQNSNGKKTLRLDSV